MLKRLIVVGILISVILVSGCIQQETQGEKTTESKVTSSQIEEQANTLIEQELEEATQNIDVGDIENSLVE